MQRHHSLLGLAASAALLLPALALPAMGVLGGDDGAEHSAESRAKVQELFTQALSDAKNEVTYGCNGKCETEGPGACPAASSPRVKLTSLAAKNAYALDVLQPLVMEAMTTPSTTDAEARLVFDVLLETRSRSAGAIAEAIFAEAPRRFDGATLLAFCEMGSKELVAPLSKAVKAGEGGVPAAAYLAIRGDKAGKRTLKKALALREVTLANAADILIAGIGMHHLGDGAALERARMLVHDAAIEALDGEELDIARSLAVTASVCRSIEERSQAVLSWIGATCEETEAKALLHGKLETADEIFALLQDATPIG